ncbi:MAG TPA: hypothetical protein VLD39_16570, partial [Gammaproteobacteria bacterium]|nr:hypothetical protein [Gammaproteobacteria bacterium]
GLPALALGVWLARTVDLSSWIATGACVAVTGLVALLGVASLATSRWERARYTATLRRVLSPALARGE